MATTPPAASIGAFCPTCGESIEELDTFLGNAVVDAFTKRHAGHDRTANELAEAASAVLNGYGKSGQGARMAQLQDAVDTYQAVNR